MGLAVDGDGDIGARRLGQAEDLAGRLVEPVTQVADAVFVLHVQVFEMRVRESVWCHTLQFV